MVDVGQVLVVGVGVNRGHQAAFDTQFAMQHLGDRRQAVGGARRVGDDLVGLTQNVMVYTVDHGSVRPFGRCRDDHLARAGGNMGGSLVTVGEQAGAFEHDVDLVRGPRQVGRVANGADGNPVAIDGQAF